MDALETALANFHFDSREFSAFNTFHAPWGVSLDPWPCVQFHAVRSGGCWIRVEERRPVELAPGDFVMLPHGNRHQMLSEPGQPCRDASTMLGLLAAQLSKDWTVELEGTGRRSEVICAGFACSAAAKGPVLGSLPDFIHLRASETASLEPILVLMEAELAVRRTGSDAMLVHVAGLLLVEAVRSYARTLIPEEGGWLAALQDERISAVLRLIHADPARRWTLQALASRVGMSRSLLTSRFRALVGLPIHGYVTRLRVLVAANMLRGPGRLSLSVVAERVGYSSEPVFIRAFHRVMGQTPTGFRARI